MRTRRILLIAIPVAVVAIVGLVMFLPREREPEYGGKKLSEWVAEYDRGGDGRPSQIRKEAADNAIRKIGTKAIPFLLDWVAYETPRWKIKLYTYTNQKLHWPGRDWEAADKRINRANLAPYAFAALGSDATGAIQDLSRLVNHPATFWGPLRAATSLANIGSAGLPPLLAVLTNRHPAIWRANVVTRVGKMGTNARPAVPILIECLREDDSSLTSEAMRALGKLKLEPELAIPALVEKLQDPRAHIRVGAVSALGAFGEEARAAVPVLRGLLKDQDVWAKKAATNALSKIDPQALERATR